MSILWAHINICSAYKLTAARIVVDLELDLLEVFLSRLNLGQLRSIINVSIVEQQ